MPKVSRAPNGTSISFLHRLTSTAVRTYTERCMHVHRTTYARTPNDVRTYTERCTWPSKRDAATKRAQREGRKHLENHTPGQFVSPAFSFPRTLISRNMEEMTELFSRKLPLSAFHLLHYRVTLNFIHTPLWSVGHVPMGDMMGSSKASLTGLSRATELSGPNNFASVACNPLPR